ncbi:MAG: DNA adenine methylase [Myxococcales bacterium]|nr:DNA adenine methylase [Myxococcales bacterium]
MGGVSPAPFLKWAGGKGKLIPQYESLFPKRFAHYYEPFIGGGAIYFHLAPSRATIADINPRLADAYIEIRDNCEPLIQRLEALRTAHDRDHYYVCRERLNTAPDLDRTERVALQIYLNKTCFNGLYRENRKGHFNVPVGQYTNPSIYDALTLRACSTLLKGAQVQCRPFEEVLSEAREGDFVYLDPPYHPISETSSFTSYTKFGFDTFDQERLAETVRLLDRRGCYVMQSNSDAPFVRDLYKGFEIQRVKARRSINSKARHRGPINEVVIRNYA